MTAALNGKNFYVHRLVATAFVENPNDRPEIDHINTNWEDNRAENLRWVNRYENMHSSLTEERTGRPKGTPMSEELKQKYSKLSSGESYPMYGLKHTEEAKKKMLKAHSKSVAQFDMNGKLLATFPSAKVAEKETGVFASGITNCCRGNQKQSKGFVWRFLI